MADPFTPSASPPAKSDRYGDLSKEIAAVVADEPNRIARMASVAAMLAASFEHFFWTGFYVVDATRPRELVVGPYQGSLGCLRIAFGRGVCGTAAQRGETVIVDDVDAFPGHIACDTRSRSEIVVPVFDSEGVLIAVLDVDSTSLAAFDDEDARALEKIVHQVFAINPSA